MENIFVIPYDEKYATGFFPHIKTLHYQNKQTFNIRSTPWNGYCTLAAFYNSFDAMDERRKMFLVGQQYSKTGVPLTEDNGEPLVFTVDVPSIEFATQSHGARGVKYEIASNAMFDLSNDYVIFRYADVLLSKAEALLRIGNETDALKLVNSVRERAFEPDKPLNALSLEDLLKERGFEFAWEGFRRQDLIRFGEWEKPWQHKGQTDESTRLFPIPQDELDKNPNLKRNDEF